MSSLQTGSSGNHHKFPFLIVPLSHSQQTLQDLDSNSSKLVRGVRKQSNDSMKTNSSPCPSSSSEVLIPKKNSSGNLINVGNSGSSNSKIRNDVSRRSTSIQKQLNAQFSQSTLPLPATLLQTFFPHAQLGHPKHVYQSAQSTATIKSEPLTDQCARKDRFTEDNNQELRTSKISSIRQVKVIPCSARSINQTSGTLPPENSPTTVPRPRRRLRKPRHEYDCEVDTENRDYLASAGDCSTLGLTSKTSTSFLRQHVQDLERQLRVRDVEISHLKDALVEVKNPTEDYMYNNCCQSLKEGLVKVEKKLEDLEEKVDYCDGDYFKKSSTASQNYYELDMDENPLLTRPLFSPDFDRIVRSTRELAARVGNSGMELCYNSGGASATFKHAAPVTITMYKNGLRLDDSPELFKTFSTPSTHQFIQDIYDGYFPSELQTKYPDGVSLIIEDKRSQIYSTKDHGCFGGRGKKISETTWRKQTFPYFLPGMKFEAKKSAGLSKVQLASESSSSSTLSLKFTKHEQLPELIPEHLRSFHNKRLGTRSIVTLKLKNMITGDLYKFRASIGATVENLLDHLEEHLDADKSESDDEVETNSRKFELINALPFGSFASLGSTLKEYGITSNTLLYFRPTEI